MKLNDHGKGPCVVWEFKSLVGAKEKAGLQSASTSGCEFLGVV